MQKRTKVYFAYGSNLNRSIMRIFAQNEPLDCGPTYILENFELRFHCGLANIIPWPGGKVYGGLYRITEDMERLIDIYEGDGNLYEKETFNFFGEQIFYYRMTKEEYLIDTPPNIVYLMRILDGYGDWKINTNNLLDAVRAAINWAEEARSSVSLGRMQAGCDSRGPDQKKTRGVLEGMTAEQRKRAFSHDGPVASGNQSYPKVPRD